MPPKKILVVDDHSDTRAICDQLLSFYGYTVLLAENGAEALARAVEHEPQLVLMDYLMPQGDGLSVTATLREHERLRDIPVVLFTAAAMQMDSFQDAPGIARVLYKPVEVHQLLRVVRDLIGPALDELTTS